MVKRAISCLLVLMLITGIFSICPSVKAQTADPSTATINVSGVPAGTTSLAVEVTVDSSVISLASASSSVSGALAVTGGNGVGIISTSGELPASFTVTVNLGGVAAGTSMFAVGAVKTSLADTGTAIAGASATSDTTSVTVSGSSTTSSTSSSSSTGGAGTLDNDTVTIQIAGAEVGATNALNVTLAFGNSSIVSLDAAAPSVSGMGITQLLTTADAATGVIGVVWDGTSSDNSVTITAMLKAGATGGTTSVGVAKVEAAGSIDITSNVAISVNPEEVTNGSGSSSSSTGGVAGDCGTFTLVSPNNALVGPGTAAVGVQVENGGANLSATINGEAVDFVSSSKGVAIVDLPSSGSLDLSLSASCDAGNATASLGSLDVAAATSEKAPSVKRASAKLNTKKGIQTLTATGKNLKDGSAEIVPTDREADSVRASGKRVRAAYLEANCIPSGSYVNVTTAGGTSAAEIRVMGDCSNSL
jgi:trimeric autotransporter adhesin